jgi:hypothetical protein
VHFANENLNASPPIGRTPRFDQFDPKRVHLSPLGEISPVAPGSVPFGMGRRHWIAGRRPDFPGQSFSLLQHSEPSLSQAHPSKPTSRSPTKPSYLSSPKKFRSACFRGSNEEISPRSARERDTLNRKAHLVRKAETASKRW